MWEPFCGAASAPLLGRADVRILCTPTWLRCVRFCRQLREHVCDVRARCVAGKMDIITFNGIYDATRRVPQLIDTTASCDGIFGAAEHRPGWVASHSHYKTAKRISD